MNSTLDKHKIAIVVNGEPVSTAAVTLREVVEEYAAPGGKVATALNGNFVPEKSRASTRLQAGDKIEIVSPRQGG